MKTRFRHMALICLALALLGRLTAPDFPGFYLLPLAAGLVLALLAGPGQWRAAGACLTQPGRRGGLTAGLWAAASLALLLAAGSIHNLPATDLGAGCTISLSPETARLLAKLDRPVKITIHLGPQDAREARIRELAHHYVRASRGFMNFIFINPQTAPRPEPSGPRLVGNDTALVEAEGFRENVAPISEEAINGALTRLLIPERRLVYFLNTFGEKMIGDTGPFGLSGWAEDLAAQRIMALDYYWPEGAAIPPEASAVVLAGPRAPLGQGREAALLAYIKNGGRVMIMADPLTVALSPDFWRPFGLKYPDGFMVDPESNLAGTDEAFVISRQYPAHPLTHGLTQPVVWPLAGAFVTEREDGHAELPAETYAVAMSSFASWLETDAASFSEGPRYQPGADLSGPLALAAASQLKGGGRLVALADSDLAANSFRGFPGNGNFTLAAIHWLLDGGPAPHAALDKTKTITFSPVSARLAFWLPVVVWPLSILALWLFFIRRKRA